jgi:deoxyribonuclease IV
VRGIPPQSLAVQDSSVVRPCLLPVEFSLTGPGASYRFHIKDIRDAYALGAACLVTHMGSHKNTNEYAGLKRLQGALNRIIAKTADTPVTILLENTSGSGSWLGYTFKHHRTILKGIKDKARVALCLDTAHAYAAGYDLASEEGLGQVLDEIDRYAGLSLLTLIHLNDTKEKLGSHIDRHEHIGKGRIGEEGMRRIVNHKSLRECAFILETPKKTPEDDPLNLAVTRRLRQGE